MDEGFSAHAPIEKLTVGGTWMAREIQRPEKRIRQNTLKDPGPASPDRVLEGFPEGVAVQRAPDYGSSATTRALTRRRFG